MKQNPDADVIWYVCLDCGMRWPTDPNHDVFERPKGHQNKCRHANSQFDTSLQKLHGIIWWKCFDCGRLRRVNFLDKDTITINEFYYVPYFGGKNHMHKNS